MTYLANIIGAIAAPRACPRCRNPRPPDATIIGARSNRKGRKLIRRHGTPPVAGHRYIRRPGVYAVLLDGQAVLTTLQTAPVPEYQLPGGGIDRGEHPVAALHREVMEETGWRMAVLRRLGAFRRFTHMPEYDLWAEKVCTVYLCRPIRRLGPPTEAGHRAVWMAGDDAVAALDNPGDVAFLRKALRD